MIKLCLVISSIWLHQNFHYLASLFNGAVRGWYN
jgi:hypothetical protein